MKLVFSDRMVELAYESWGMNCGPSALAVCCELDISQAKKLVEPSGFLDKKYMSPTMMKSALDLGKFGFSEVDKNRKLSIKQMKSRWPASGLMRVQWTGPWSGKYAYHFTHWVACGGGKEDPVVFDINCGILPLKEWMDFASEFIKEIERADGWHPTHIWEVWKDAS